MNINPNTGHSMPNDHDTRIVDATKDALSTIADETAKHGKQFADASREDLSVMHPIRASNTP